LSEITIRPDWSSFYRLVQDLISGVVRRHTFNQWELEFLLDLQGSRLRRSSRDSVLRRYLRSVQQQNAEGTPEPTRLCAFLEREYPARSAATGRA
jgi:hypothetical protein